MKKTLCYSVRVKSLEQISDKCYKAEGFDGSSALIPTSQVFGCDYEVQKSDAYWISAWILERKSLTYSRSKKAWFGEDGSKLPTYTVEKHIPEKVVAKDENIINQLKK